MMKKSIIVGLSVGIVLAIANLFLLGFVGIQLVTIFFHPLRFLFSFLITGCSGESCLGPFILVDSLSLILGSLLVSFFYSLNYKHFVQKIKNGRTKYVIIYDVIFIGLVLFSMFTYFKAVCLSNESCIIQISNISSSDSICKYTGPGTRFNYDKENPSSYNSFGFGEGACYSKMALVNNNESFCTKSSNQREQDDCYVQLSRVRPDISLCQKINVGGYDEDDINTSGMNSFAQLDRDYCYKNIASTTGDVSTCELIQDNDNKQLCLAILHKDKNYCENIDKGVFMFSESARTECVNYFK